MGGREGAVGVGVGVDANVNCFVLLKSEGLKLCECRSGDEMGW